MLLQNFATWGLNIRNGQSEIAQRSSYTCPIDQLWHAHSS